MYKFLKFKSEQSSVTVQYERLLQYNNTAVWRHLNEHVNSSLSSTQNLTQAKHRRFTMS